MKRFALILLVLVVLLIVPACQKKAEGDENKILGHWEFTLRNSEITETYMVTFDRTLTQGFWVMDMGDNQTLEGTWQVSGDTVQMIITKASFENGITGSFTGQFENDNKMSGDFSVSDSGSPPTTGTWTAVRK